LAAAAAALMQIKGSVVAAPVQTCEMISINRPPLAPR